MQTLISIELQAHFGFFKKPDTNADLNLSFNMLHKPALLGILGAIIGLDGYIAASWDKKKDNKPNYPVFVEKLNGVRVGIEPIGHTKGNFSKTTILYTDTTGFNNKDKNKLPTTRLIKELTLIKPAYKCYILLDLDNEHQHRLYSHLKEGKATYLPYFGKNEFYAWWDKDSFNEYEFETNKPPADSFEIKTLFKLNEEALKNQTTDTADAFDLFDPEKGLDDFRYFERLPEGFDDAYTQYKLSGFALTTHKVMPQNDIKDLYYLKNEQCYVQLI